MSDAEPQPHPTPRDAWRDWSATQRDVLLAIAETTGRGRDATISDLHAAHPRDVCEETIRQTVNWLDDEGYVTSTRFGREKRHRLTDDGYRAVVGHYEHVDVRKRMADARHRERSDDEQAVLDAVRVLGAESDRAGASIAEVVTAATQRIDRLPSAFEALRRLCNEGEIAAVGVDRVEIADGVGDQA